MPVDEFARRRDQRCGGTGSLSLFTYEYRHTATRIIYALGEEILKYDTIIAKICYIVSRHASVPMWEDQLIHIGVGHASWQPSRKNGSPKYHIDEGEGPFAVVVPRLLEN